MRGAVIVFVGGGIGSCLRAVALAWLSPWSTWLPVLLVNLVGSFVIGLVFALADEAGLLRVQTRLFVAVGVLGGFTTFSTFGWGADLLAGRGAGAIALAYVVVSVVGGVAAAGAGLVAGREVVVALERAAVGLLGRLDERGLRRTANSRRESEAETREDRRESA
jgi:fluoride exporter